jgi:ParB/RepB/Spo0J family partition protein
MTQFIENLEIVKIRPNPEQPRKKIRNLTGLAETIRDGGIRQPVVVVKNADGSYTLRDGERRVEAAKLAGHKTVPAIVLDGGNFAIDALIANNQRDALLHSEIAESYQKLRDAGETLESMAKRLGVTSNEISQKLQLLALPFEVRGALDAGFITQSAAKQFLRLRLVDSVASKPSPFDGGLANVHAHNILWHQLFCLSGEATVSAVSDAVDFVFVELAAVVSTYGDLPADEADRKAKAVLDKIGGPAGAITCDGADQVEAELALRWLQQRPDFGRLTNAQREDIEHAVTRWNERHGLDAAA